MFIVGRERQLIGHVPRGLLPPLSHSCHLAELSPTFSIAWEAERIAHSPGGGTILTTWHKKGRSDSKRTDMSASRLWYLPRGYRKGWETPHRNGGYPSRLSHPFFLEREWSIPHSEHRNQKQDAVRHHIPGRHRQATSMYPKRPGIPQFCDVVR